LEEIILFGIKNKTSKKTKTSDIDKYRFRTKFGMTNDSRHPELVSCSFGFTLAEVLITLGVVGIVAAMTLPTVMTNVNERIRKEQVRTVKYKLTQATDKMKSLGLIGPYATTEDFVNELRKHLKIAKVCDNQHLDECWPTKSISTPDGEVKVKTLTTGAKIKALALGTAATRTVGIVTGDGVPMILAYSPICNALSPEKTYLWSTVDNKPETNATTNCISAVFDINGAKKLNRIGTDVRTLNSLFGSKQYAATAISKDECNRLKSRLGINGCYYDTDYWAGAVKKCHDIGMHLPSMQTLAVIAGAKYGRTDIGTYTLIMRNDYSTSDYQSTGNCLDYFKEHNYGNRLSTSDVICVDTLPNGANSSIASLSGGFWSSAEVSAGTAQKRYIYSFYSTWYTNYRYNGGVPLCLGD
uniref:type II secretion system protein n=1 Tax=Candidatus Scatousia sp. TaxID=3085663 RepID=UPI0040254BA9